MLFDLVNNRLTKQHNNSLIRKRF